MAAEPAAPGTGRRSPLLVDLYELTMAESYLAEGIAERRATFEVTVRRLPEHWGYLLAAGLDGLLEELETLHFDGVVLEFLELSGLFGARFLERLERFRFRGEVRAMPEGTVFFADEPILELTGSLLEAQLVETTVLNRLHFPSLVAAKAARCVDAAAGRRLADFSVRRAHGADASLHVARGAYLAGFDSTSNVLAGARFEIPVSGTMAHSFVEAFGDEVSAFEAFTRSYPDGATLLIDTYDTLEGARRAARVALALRERGGRLGGVRLDSGDLLSQSLAVRRLLDESGLPELSIVASGNLDEHTIALLLAAGAPIDGFGVGTRLGVSADAPSLDMAYKLVSLDGRAVMKLSPGKQTLPGVKQVWRLRQNGGFRGDLISLRDEPAPPGGVALLQAAMRDGVRLTAESLPALRERAAAERAALPGCHRQLEAEPYPVAQSSALRELAARLSAELSAPAAGEPR